MIDYLKKLTIKNAGFEIKDRGDCQLLSELILERTDELLSYNTLRRLFGLIGFVKPNKNTLDVLARFNGYKDYLHFIKINPYEAYWCDKEKLYQLLTDDPNKIIDFVNQIDYKSEQALDFMISLCRELIYLNKFQVFEEVFNTRFFNDRIFSYSETLHFGNSIGILFKNNRLPTKKILLNQNFLKFVFTIYVDYSNLNGYYGEWCVYVCKNTNDIQLQYFSSALLELKKYLNGKSVNKSNFDLVDIKDFHPILIGRLFSIKLLSNDVDNDEVNNFLEFIKKSDNEKILDYLYEPMIVAILSKNFIFMETLIHFVLNQKIKVTYYYHEHHMKLFSLLQVFYSKYLLINSEAKIIIENVVDTDDFKYSYKELLALLVAVFKFNNNDETNKSNYLEYTEISNKLKYPFFSDSYLVNYFG
jgi:hypothetical protein